MDNYKKIINAFLAGDIENIDEKGMIPEHLETQISHLFLFPKTVYKICKRDNVFFNEHFRNLADRKSRLDFYKSDFFENNYFSPDVYLNLYGIGLKDGKVTIGSDIDDAEDFIMKMRRIDWKYSLSNLLHERTLSQKDFQLMGYQQTKDVARYPHQPKTNETFYNIFQRRLDDLRDWMYSAPEYISKDKINEIVHALRSYIEKEKDIFMNFDKSQYVVTIDNHSDNIFFEKGKMIFLDVYPPKEDWIIVPPWINIYRPTTDILILMGEKYARSFIQGYKDYYGYLDEGHELFYFLYSAAIQGVSLHNLSKDSDVKKKDSELYKAFILENIEKLEKENL